ARVREARLPKRAARRRAGHARLSRLALEDRQQRGQPTNVLSEGDVLPGGADAHGPAGRDGHPADIQRRCRERAGALGHSGYTVNRGYRGRQMAASLNTQIRRITTYTIL